MRYAVMLLVVGCAGPNGAIRTPPSGDDSVDSAIIDTDTGHTGEPSACEPGMVAIDDFCIDAWEAHLVDASPYDVPTGAEVAASAAGHQPQGYISGALAEAVCANAGKRLCDLDEWMRACQGPDGRTYPYGDTYDPTACNTSRSQHPLDSLFGDDPNRWTPSYMNDPRVNQQEDTVDPGGANPRCVSAEGVYDLHGNLHEWVSDPSGTFKGGFYMDASINGEGCYYRTTAHAFGYHDYSTGFRCCADPS